RHRLVRRGNGQVDEAPHFFHFFFFDEIQRIEIPDFGSDLAGMLRRVELADPADAAFTRQKVLPNLFSLVADRADQAEPGYDDSSRQLLPRFRVLANVIDGVLDGAYFLGVFVGDLDFESFFESHYQLDGVQRVGAKVVH